MTGENPTNDKPDEGSATDPDKNTTHNDQSAISEGTPLSELYDAWYRRHPDPLTPEQEAEREAVGIAIGKKLTQQRKADAWRVLCEQVGERYRNCTLSGYEVQFDAQANAVKQLRDYTAAFAENMKQGRSIVLFGPVGTGKDHLLVAMLRVAIHHDCEVGWVNGMDLFGEFRDAIDSGRPESAIISRYAEGAVLGISDPLPPGGSLTEFQAAALYRIIDRRYRAQRATWLTVNCDDAAEVEQRMGIATLDRLRHGSLKIRCDWPSYRSAAR